MSIVIASRAPACRQAGSEAWQSCPFAFAGWQMTKAKLLAMTSLGRLDFL